MVTLNENMRDVRQIGYHKPGKLEMTLTSKTDIQSVMPFAKISYEAS